MCPIIIIIVAGIYLPFIHHDTHIISPSHTHTYTSEHPPIHSVKTRLQVQEKTAAAGPPKYRGIFQSMVVIVREEGVARLYRGLLPRMLRVPPGMVRACLVLCSGCRKGHTSWS